MRIVKPACFYHTTTEWGQGVLNPGISFQTVPVSFTWEGSRKSLNHNQGGLVVWVDLFLSLVLLPVLLDRLWSRPRSSGETEMRNLNPPGLCREGQDTVLWGNNGSPRFKNGVTPWWHYLELIPQVDACLLPAPEAWNAHTFLHQGRAGDTSEHKKYNSTTPCRPLSKAEVDAKFSIFLVLSLFFYDWDMLPRSLYCSY